MSGPRVIALGDSVSVGVGDRTDDGTRLGWAAHLAAALGSDDFTNLSRTGARARDVLAEQLAPALAANADVATLLVGGNDVLRNDFDPDRVGRDTAEVAEWLTSRGTVVAVVLLHDPVLVLPRGGGVFGRVIGARATLVNAAIRQHVADLEGVVLVDPRLDPSTNDRASWHVDRMHPSAVGHRRLAWTVADALAAHGFAATGEVPDVPASCPGPIEHAIWLVRNGIPWFAKRSMDLVPELVRVVVSERSAYADAAAR
jgi:lysophospholipase L1-like esterase